MIKKEREIIRAIAERIKKIREKLSLYQRDLAEAIGVQPSYISKVEKGEGSPGPLFFYKISTEYNISLEYLFHGTGDMFKSTPEANKNDSREFPDTIETIEDISWLFENSDIFRTAVVAFACKFAFENESIIKKNINKGQEKKAKL